MSCSLRVALFLICFKRKSPSCWSAMSKLRHAVHPRSLPGCVTAFLQKTTLSIIMLTLHHLPWDLVWLNAANSQVSPVNCAGCTHSSGTTVTSAPVSQVMGSLWLPIDPKTSFFLSGTTLFARILIFFTWLVGKALWGLVPLLPAIKAGYFLYKLSYLAWLCWFCFDCWYK